MWSVGPLGNGYMPPRSLEAGLPNLLRLQRPALLKNDIWPKLGKQRRNLELRLRELKRKSAANASPKLWLPKKPRST